MKGSLGIIVAVFLGLVALTLNWYYLYSKTRDVDTVSFIGIKPGVTIRAGQTLQEQHFEPVAIPVRSGSGRVDRLQQYAYLYDDVKTVANIVATRDYEGGDLCFPEFGPQTYRAPTGGAVVFSCSLLHEARPVSRGRRYAFLPFLYDDVGARTRERNLAFVAPELQGYRSGLPPEDTAAAQP